MTPRRAFSSVGRGLRPVGFWLLVLLGLPNCTLNRSGLLSPQNLDRGASPWNGAVFCDIEKPLRRCVSTLTDEERASAIRLAEAAIALVEGRSSSIGIDDSADAIVRCGAGGEAVFFEGPYPQGLHVCLNCDVVGGSGRYASPVEVCRNRCYDFYGVISERSHVPDIPPVPEVQAFCDARARLAINTPTDACLDGPCSGGILRADFVDSRRSAEPADWVDLIGTLTPGGGVGNLTRTAPTSGLYDAGAVSSQWVTRGDAYVEFNGTGGQMVGLTEIPPGCAEPCPDTDPGAGGIGFAIELGADGLVYVVERGVRVAGPDVNGSFGAFGVDERFRIHLRDNGDGSAGVSYARVIGTCLPGTPCDTTQLTTSAGRPRYPLRADATLQEAFTSVIDVRFARIR
jgi:hypothetical protein